MLDWLGKIYTFEADRHGYEPRQVDRDWLAASGLHQHATENGVELAWVTERRIATLEHEGWLVVHENDHQFHTRRKLVNRDTVLIARKKPENA